MKALRVAGKVVGTVGRYTLAGVLIVGHFVMNIIGVLICAITSQGEGVKYGQERNNAEKNGAQKL